MYLLFRVLGGFILFEIFCLKCMNNHESFLLRFHTFEFKSIKMYEWVLFERIVIHTF